MGTGGGGVTASHRAADALGHKSQNGRAPVASRQEPADGGRSPAPPTRCKAPLGTRRLARGVQRPAPHPLIQVQASGWRCPHSPDTRHTPPCYTRSALCTPYWCKPQRAMRICLVRPLKVGPRSRCGTVPRTRASDADENLASKTVPDQTAPRQPSVCAPWPRASPHRWTGD